MSVRLDDNEVLDPRIQGIKPYRVSEWRNYLRSRLYIRRKGRSDLSGKPLTGFQVHEAIITRAEAHKTWQWMIYHEYNCLLLLPEEHIPSPPSREEAFKILAGYYGRDKIIEWIESLPSKRQLRTNY